MFEYAYSKGSSAEINKLYESLLILHITHAQRHLKNYTTLLEAKVDLIQTK